MMTASALLTPFANPTAALTLLALLAGASALSADEIRLDQPVNASIPEALLLHWPFDEIAGVEVANTAKTGNSYNGFLFAGGFEAPQFVPGVTAAYGNAIHLNGGPKVDIHKDANPYAQWVGDNSLHALDLVSTAFTAGLWVSPDQPSGEGQTSRLLSRGRFGTGNFWDLSLKNVSTRGDWRMALDFTVGAAGEEAQSVRAWLPRALAEGEWHHLAVTVEPQNDQEARVTLYVNGKAVGDGSLPLISGNLSSPDRRVTVGERAVSTYQSEFRGRIDDVFIAEGVHRFTSMPSSSSTSKP